MSADPKVIAGLRAEEEAAYALYTAARELRLKAMQLETALSTEDPKDDLVAAEALHAARARLEAVRFSGLSLLREAARRLAPQLRAATRFPWRREDRRGLVQQAAEILEELGAG